MAAAVPAKAKPAFRPAERPSRRWLNRALAALLVGGLVAIGIVGAVAFNRLRPRVVEDAARVVELTGSVLDIDVPEQFRPRGTIEWSVGAVGSVRGAYYDVAGAGAGAGADGLLMIIAVDSRYSDRSSVRAHVERVLREEGGDTADLVRQETPRTRNVSIRGEAVPFTFATRKARSSQEEYRLIEGVVEGAAGQVLIAVRFRNGGPLTEEAVVRMLESIR